MLRRISACLFGFALAGASWSATYTVTTQADTGPGSLRWAIVQADDHSGPDRIIFDPSLSGKGIRPKSTLPSIYDKRTTLNGDIDGDGAPDITLNGVNAGSAYGLAVTADNCRIVGLAIVRFAEEGILLHSCSGCVIRSCHVGVNRPGMKLARNGGEQIRLWKADSNTIGGRTAAGRNVIAAGSASPMRSGIYLAYSSENLIRNNNIGIARDGLTPLTAPDDSGVGITLYGMVRRAGGRSDGDMADASLRTRSNHIGEGACPHCPAQAPGNALGGMKTGMDLRDADYNYIVNNYFGLARDGETHVPISGHCIRVRNGSCENRIGLNFSNRNVISGGWSGVRFDHPGTRSNKVMGNYFGLNLAGTHERPLARGIECHNDAGPQTLKNNYLCGKHAAADTVGIMLNWGGSGSLIEWNQFGYYGSTPHYAGVMLLDVYAKVMDNRFYGSDMGIYCDSTPAGCWIIRSIFRYCGTAVRLTGGARVNLGDLGNRTSADDGGNEFYGSNTWYIRNETSHLTKAEGNRFPGRGSPHGKIWDKNDNPSLGRVDIFPLGDALSGVAAGSAVAVTSVATLPTADGAEVVFTLSSAAQVEARILNIAGRPINTLCHGKECEVGTSTLVWNAADDGGLAVPNGTYLVEVTARAEDGSRARAVGQVSVSR